MEALLQHLFTQFICEESSQLLPQLYKLKSITLTSAHHFTPADLQLIQYLLSKNFISYSAAHLQIKLEPHSILLYQRVHKLKKFAAGHTHPLFCSILQSFFANEMLPLAVLRKNMQSLQQSGQRQQQSKGKRKKERLQQMIDEGDHLDYNRLLYESSDKAESKEESVDCMVNIGELTDLIRFWKIEQQLGKRRDELLKSASYKENEQKLHSLSFIQMYKTIKENRAKAQFVKDIMKKVRAEKIEQYILQLFRRYEFTQQEGNNNNNFARNALLVFNLIRKMPYVSQKELLGHSLLAVLELRRCTNLLATEGLISCYPQSIRSVLYNAIEEEQLESRFVDELARACLNLHLVGSSKGISKQHLLKVQCMLSDLDDILLLFGY